MFGAGIRPVRIVVKLNVLWPPPKDMGEPVRQHNLEHGFERGRPTLGSANGRLAPIKGADEFSHFAAAGEE
jgi:hypothetical protein